MSVCMALMPAHACPFALILPASLPARLRALSYAWTVVSAASKQAELEAAAAAATGPRLVLPAQLVGQLAAGSYVLRLTVTNWLGASASTDLTVTKAALVLPQLAIVGGAAQTFSVSSGIRVQTAIELASVCSGALLVGGRCLFALMFGHALSGSAYKAVLPPTPPFFPARLRQA